MAVCEGLRETGMRVVALFLVLVFSSFSAAADLFPTGVCGGVTWLDDPDQEFRLYIAYTDDLPLLAAMIQNIEIEHDVVTVNLYANPGHREGAGFECGVIVARRVCDINIEGDCDDNP